MCMRTTCAVSQSSDTILTSIPLHRRSHICMSTLSKPQLVQYLQRINVAQGFPKQSTPSLTTLAQLQFAHVKSIPFENLTLHHPKALERKEVISCKLEEVFEKLVQKPRGGYCFEQNTLFAAVLRTLSFKVYTAAARVVQSIDADRQVNQLTGTEHMVIIVTLEDGSKWLTDVGFGGQVPRRPLRIDQVDLDPEKDSRTYGYRHRLRPGLMHSSLQISETDVQTETPRAGFYLQCTNREGGWKDLYFFHLKECFAKDFEIYNWWCATAPQGAMKSMTIAAIQTEHGRVTYDGKTVKVFECTEVGGKIIYNVNLESQGKADEELHNKMGINVCLQ